jgi:hypothetical protein
MTRNHLISPPAAHLAIRIGVTGHRPNRLTQADAALLRTKIGEVLEIVCHTAHDILAASGSAFAPGPPILRVISSLAEGADRIVAQEALDRGFELQCPLPFDRDEYEKDFETPESRAAYRAMLAKASAVLELDGSRETTERENASYEAVGRMVLQHTDVLIAIWDGEEVAGKGGTGQIVQEAIGLGVSTVWLRSSVPHDVSLLVDDNDFKRRKRKLEGLSDQLRRLLLPPSPSPDRHQGQFFERLRRLLFPPTLDLRQQYFAEKQPSKTILGAFFKTFRDLIAEGKPGQLRWQLRDFEEATTAEWQQAWQASPGFPQVVSEQINCQYRTHYAWADKLADYYANLYRSSFVAIYLMGASAVLFALFTWVKPLQPLLGANTHEEAVWSVLELGLILLILLIYWLGIRRHWHKRWIDYRLLAEQLRHMRFLAPLGRTLPAFRVPAHDVHGDPRRSWVNWHFRAIAREAGLVNARIDTGYLEAYRQLLVGHEIKS